MSPVPSSVSESPANTLVAVPTGAPSAASSRGPRGIVRFFRAATSSVFATLASQAALVVMLWCTGNPAVSSTVAFFAGAVPNYLLARRWVWSRRGRPSLATEIVPYLAVIGLGWLASVGLTAGVDRILAPLGLPYLVWVALTDFAYVSGYALVFVVKFTLLDRFVLGRGAGRTRATTSPS